MSGQGRSLSYGPLGMTCPSGPSAPDGFHVLEVEMLLGQGHEVFTAASDALFSWRTHRRAGLRVPPGTAEPAPGVEVRLRVGPLGAPCRVIWSVRERDRVGFAYGTLRGHPVRGEESFVIDRLVDGSVRFTVAAYSKPAAWYLRAAGPLGRVGQRLMAVRYGRALRRCV